MVLLVRKDWDIFRANAASRKKPCGKECCMISADDISLSGV
jgi:hypothetical protein